MAESVEADKDIVVEAAWLGEAAEVFVPLLSYRYDQSPTERVAIINVLGATGNRNVATPKLVSILEDPKAGFLHDDVVRALKSKGPTASSAKSNVLRWLARAEFDHADGLEALSAMGEKLERHQMAPLMFGYKKRCARAGSVFMFNLGRDADCARQRAALEAICERSGIWFRDQSGPEE